ncbi:TadE/TadG family type IV pilus assembly protein [Sphingosinicella humi]|nr:TadE/TadG family type IV pilus assembly protein [Sphingosinicella humi]
MTGRVTREAMSHAFRTLGRIGSERDGAVAVEFAFVLPILLLMIAGLIDGSRFIVQQMQVESAAQAGAAQVMSKGWNEAAVIQAITSATSLPVGAEPAPRLMSACLSAGSLVEVAGSTCPSGDAAGKYVLTSARVAFDPLMPWPDLVFPPVIEGTARVRTQ